MHMHTDAERLYDFEATLRLVDNALDELQVLGGELGGGESEDFSPVADGMDAVVSDLAPLRAFREVQEGLNSLRHSRAVLERTSEEKNPPRANEASRTTGVSATDALSGLDRALLLVDRFEADQSGPADRAKLFESIREEIRIAMTCLQVHDVTEQQLSYASSILLDMDVRLGQLAHMLDPYGFEPASTRQITRPALTGDGPRYSSLRY
jgi:hypothetical protein